MANLSSIPTPERRYIDPKAQPEHQYEQLRSFTSQPPQSGSSRIITITPALAALILERLNSNNRKRRPSNIKRFAEAMTKDNWLLTGDSIKFSKNRLLLDGQNRLAACMRSGKQFKTHVIFGVDDDAFTRIDSGATRTNADTLKMAGVPYYAVVAPAIRWLMISKDAEDGKCPDRGRKIDNQELLDYYNAHIDAERIGAAAHDAMGVGRVLPPGSLAAHFYLFTSKNERIAARFIDDLTKRKAGGRVLIAKVQGLRKDNLGRVNELLTSALIIQAWNAYRQEKRLIKTMLNWDQAKEYPIIA